MTNKELLISRLNLLSEEDIASLLDAANHMEGKNALADKPDCPYCGSLLQILWKDICPDHPYHHVELTLPGRGMA